MTMKKKTNFSSSKFIFLSFISVFLLSHYLVRARESGRGINGGLKCVGCTYVIALVEQLAHIHKESMSDSAVRFCSFLPNENLGRICKSQIKFFGPWLNHVQSKKLTPDVICQVIRFCTNEKGSYCYIFPQKDSSLDFLQRHFEEIRFFPAMFEFVSSHITLTETQPLLHPFKLICKLPFIKKICFALKSYTKHMPAFDKDGDLYSQANTLRGAYWRGKDCDDTNAQIHPGTKPINSDVKVDSNCNGINGTNANNEPYEELFCTNTSQRGFAVVGDSVAAHLHIPEEWFDATRISKKSFKDFLLVFEDEFDWPQLSSATGFMNSSWSVTKGSTDSLYYRLWERNHCIHRDFQNIGINGASSLSQTKFVKSLSRNQTTDYPLLVSYALVGNDVCNWHPDTLKYMTTPKEMFTNTMQTLKYLDKILPKGSSVMLIGLVDGRLLYDTMHDRIHPIGRTWNDVTYKDVFDYMVCLQTSVCSGWLTSNKTLRELTQKRAFQLNDVLRDIYKKHNNFVNFKLYFMDNLFHKILDEWKKTGGEAWQIIEPVDGFHNNQVGQFFETKVIWETIEKNFPEVLGPINPHNKKIEQIFGNQGGY